MSDPHDAHAGPALVVLGGSARALAWSAWAAGWRVHAADLFGDADLATCTVAHTVVPRGGNDPYPQGLAAAAAAFPPAPWCYCGALENHPALVERIAAVRPLVGNGAAAIAAVRDTDRLAGIVRDAGLQWPETYAAADGLPVDGSFLVKPIASGGGRGVAAWHGQRFATDEPRCWQRRIVGRRYGASYAIAAAGARIYGVARHIVDGTRPFAFHGAVVIDPESLPRPIHDGLARFGDALAARGLRGLVGADVVVDAAGAVHVLEVNPRPTASMELVERSTGASCAAAHLAELAPPVRRIGLRAGGTWAKVIVHARRRVVADPAAWSDLVTCWTAADDGWPAMADVPHGGDVMAAGAPMCTVFARGSGVRAAVSVLRGRLAGLRAVLDAPRRLNPPSASALPPAPRRGSTA